MKRTGQQETAWQNPCRVAEQTYHPRFVRVVQFAAGGMASVILTLNVGLE